MSSRAPRSLRATNARQSLHALSRPASGEPARQWRRWLGTVAAGLTALCIVAGGTLQLTPLPDGGPSKAGAAVTPLPTPTAPRGGRVSNDETEGPVIGMSPDYAVAGGCQRWGTNYVGTTFAEVSSTTYGAWSVTQSGGVADERGTTSKNLPFHSSLQGIGQCPDYPVIGIAHTPSSGGYWIATSGGGVFSTMGAPFRGSRGTGQFTTGPTKAMKAIVADPVATGYWLVDQLGQVYWYGPTTQPQEWHGNAPSTLAGKRAFDGDSVVAMASTPTGGGYWLLTNYGTVFAIGSPAQGAMSSFTDPGLGSDLANHYVGIVSGPGGHGFWLVRDDGTTYAFGETYFGNHPPSSTGDTMVGITGTQGDASYLLMNLSGQFYQGTGAPKMTNNPYTAPPKKTTVPQPSPGGTGTEQVGGGGNTATNYPEPCAGSPVNCESGDEWETDTDVTVPGLGQHLDLARTYNSTSASTLGIFGYGWSSSYTMSVSDTPDVLATVTEADGSTVTFWTNTTGIFVGPTGTLASLTRKQTGGYTFVLRNTTTYTFNADGWLVAERDLDGYTTTLAYNASGQLTTVTDPSGRAIGFSYNATGLVASVTNPAGQVTSYGYTTKDLTSVTDPAGRVTRYTYDATHRLVTETSPTGGVTTTDYGTRGKVVRQVDPTDLTTTWRYAGTNATSGTTTINGPEGSVTKETFTKGQMVKKTTGYGTASAATWHYTYTATTFGQTSVTDPDGNTTTTTYNAAGDVTSVTEPTGDKTTTTYNSYNEPTVTVDPMGITTTDTYDVYGNLTKTVVTADSSCTSSCTETTTYTYGNASFPGEATETTDPTGNETTYTYDAHGDVATTSIDATGTLTTEALYNVLGEKICEVQPDKYGAGTRCPTIGDPRVAGTTTWTYDADGEVVAATDALTQTTATAYDVLYGTSPCTATIGAAAYCTVTTAPGSDITVVYDDQDGRQVGKVTAEGSSTQTTSGTAYDVAPGDGSCATGVATATNCVVTTNGNGQSTVTYMNAVTEAIKTVAPGNEVTTSTYDGTGNLATKTTASGTATDGYDKDNRLTSVDYSDTGSGYTKPANLAYTYNADGQKTKMVDGSGTTTYTYDGFDRLTSTNDGAGKVVSYAYNADDEVTTVTYPTGGTAHRTYNGAGQMTSTTGPGVGQITFSRSGYGSDMQTKFPNGDRETTSDNALGQQVTAKVAPSGAAVPIWSATPTPLDKTPSKLVCPSTNFCAAVTGTSILVSSNPSGGSGTWTATTPAGIDGHTLKAISCPSASLCVAGGTTGELVTSTDPTGGPSAWTATSIAGVGEITGVSCPTTTLCVAVTETSDVLTSSDPTGGASAWTTTTVSGYEEFTAVACPTKTLCLVGDWTGSLYVSSDPTGGASAWTVERAAGLSDLPISAIACSSRTLCIAATFSEGTTTATRSRVDIGHHVGTGSEAKWRVAKFPGVTSVSALSCAPTTTFCVATEVGGRIWTTTDPTYISSGSGYLGNVALWTIHDLGTGETAYGVACPNAAFCLAGEAKYTSTLGRTLAQIVTMTAGTRSFDVSDTYGTGGRVASTTETGPGGTLIDHSTYGYDAQGQIVSATVTGENAGTGSYGYDAAGDPTSLTVPGEGANTTQTFADSGELTRSSPALGSSTTFGYNGVGDRTTQTAGGQATTYSYNQAGELTKVAGRPTGFTSFTYNGSGLQTSETVPTGTVGTWKRETGVIPTGNHAASDISCPSKTFCAYVGIGYLFTSSHPAGGGGKWSGADIDGNRTLRGISCPSATFCAAVDATGNVLTSTDPSGGAGEWKSTNVSRSALGISCPTKDFCLLAAATGYVVYSTDPSAATSTWTPVHVGSSDLESLSCPSVDLCVATTSTGGKIVSSDHPTGPAATWTVATVDYRPNTTSAQSTIDCPSTSLCVAVNSAGDVLSSTDPSGGRKAWRSIQLDHVDLYSQPSISCPSTAECVIGDSTYSYVSANPTGAATTWKFETSFTGLHTISCPSEYLCVGAVGNGAVYTATAGEKTNQFTWGTVGGSPELLSDGTDDFVYGPTGEVVAQVGTTSSQKAIYLIHDALGSTVAAVNKTQLISTYAYSPYGVTIEHSGPDTTPIGFAGSYTDKMTGLLYMEHRFYTPDTGEFLSVDPDVATTGEPYEYANDDPVNLKDVTGDETCGPGVSQNHVVDTYEMEKVTEYEERTATLYCGYTNNGKGFGYRHLIGNAAKATLTWTSFNYLITATLADPEDITPEGTTKWVYSRHMSLVMTSSGLIKWTGTFEVVRAAYTAKIITAFARTWKLVTQTLPYTATFASATSGGCGVTVM